MYTYTINDMMTKFYGFETLESGEILIRGSIGYNTQRKGGGYTKHKAAERGGSPTILRGTEEAIYDKE